MTDANDFRNQLIEETVLQALESKLYAELYSGINPLTVKTVADLATLPIVTKDQLRAHESEWALRSGQTAYIQNTTGSTGEPLFIYRSHDEAKFIWDFFSEYSRDSSSGPRPLQLNFDESKHGNPTSVPAYVHVLSGSAIEDKHIEHVLLLLRKQFKIRGVAERISILSGQQLPILLLTNFLLENDINRSEFAIKLICTSGRYLTRRWRETLEKVWGAIVIDRYSLSEVFGGASSCGHCRGYHFDTHVVPELVEPVSHKVVSEGLGLLVLTSLYPFVQAQPMIRYLTGDLMELRTGLCYAPTYFIKGRFVHALMHPQKTGQILLAGPDIIEALDGIPSINRTRHYKDVTSISYSQAVGSPYVRGRIINQNNRPHVVLELEVNFTSGLFPRYEDDIKSTILTELRSSSPTFNSALEQGDFEFDIQLLRSGQLASLEKRTALWNK
jgi:hypothetical protein